MEQGIPLPFGTFSGGAGLVRALNWSVAFGIDMEHGYRPPLGTENWSSSWQVNSINLYHTLFPRPRFTKCADLQTAWPADSPASVPAVA